MPRSSWRSRANQPWLAHQREFEYQARAPLRPPGETIRRSRWPLTNRVYPNSCGDARAVAGPQAVLMSELRLFALAGRRGSITPQLVTARSCARNAFAFQLPADCD